MIIKDIATRRANNRIVVFTRIESDHYGLDELWFSLPEKYNDYICDSQLDGFVIAMLYPAMKYGENIHVKGGISERLFFNLNNYVIPLLQDFSPDLKRIEITADSISNMEYKGSGVGMSFSAGVDSFCTLYDRYVLESMPTYKVNSLLFFNVGSNGDWLENGSKEFTKNKFEKRFSKIKNFTDEIGLDFLDVDSNLHFYHDWWHSYSHSLKSSAVMVILQKYYSKYYYPSAGLSYGNTLKFSDLYKSIDIGAFCDPILLPLLSTESLEIISDGCSYTRSEKILHTMNYEPVRRFLNVCVQHTEEWENCSVCKKCLRTLLTLDITGNLEPFASVFDLKRYHEKRYAYLCSQIEASKTDPFASDNIKLARERGVKLPFAFRAKFARAGHALFLLVKNSIKMIFIIPKMLMTKFVRMWRALSTS